MRIQNIDLSRISDFLIDLRNKKKYLIKKFYLFF